MSKKTSTENKANTSEIVQCKNCETEFSGKFCPNCGQSAKEFEKPLSFFLIDLAGNIFAFDTRFWKTLSSVILRPGKLAADYLDGRRARYMPPFRFYIFISFIFFLMLSLFIKKHVELDHEFSRKLSHSIDTAILDHKNDSTLEKLNDSIYVKRVNDTLILELDSLSNAQIIAPKESEEDVLYALKSILTSPDIYLLRFLKYLSWSLFFLMPFYGLLLWLFFHGARKYYYGHLILSINQHAFMFFLCIILLIIKFIFPGRENHPENYLALIIPAYMYIGTLKLYGQKWVYTFFKLLGTYFIYTFCLALVVGFVFYFWFRTEFL